MTKILVNNKYCKIENELDQDFLKRLDNYMSFTYNGYEYTPAHRFHGWNGKERLLSSRLQFNSGLLEYATDFYKQNNKSFEIISSISVSVSNEPIDILPKLKEIGIVPYDYQLNAVKFAEENYKGIFKHATGSGKSITAALIAANFNKPTIIYVISRELLTQFHDLFSKLFDQKIGFVGDGRCEVENITIASIWSIGSALGMKKTDMAYEDFESDETKEITDKEKLLAHLKNTKIHLIDECHLSATKTIKNIYKAINPERIYGFSGTPSRDDGADLLITGIFGSKIDEVSASSLIKRGILAKPIIKFIPITGQAHFTDKYQTVYSQNVVNGTYRNAVIVKKVQSLLNKGYQVLVLFNLINHGKILHKLFKEARIEHDILSGKDDAEKRGRIKQDMLDKKLNCLLASRIFDIGIDIKTITALVLSGSGASSVATIQRIGRALRDGKNKPNGVAVIEFFDRVRFLKKHSLIRKSIYEKEEEFVVIFPEDEKDAKKK